MTDCPELGPDIDPNEAIRRLHGAGGMEPGQVEDREPAEHEGFAGGDVAE